MRRVALIHKHFRPYHMAQARALLRSPALDVRCLELKDAEGGYQPKGASERLPELTTLGSHRHQAALRQLPQRVWETLEAWQPDCVVVAGYNSPALRRAAAWARARGKACAMILSVTGFAGWRDWVAWPAKAWFVRTHVDAAFVGGRRHAEYLAALGLPRDRIWQGYEAVDNAFIATGAERARREADRAREALQLPRNFFLYVGRFNQDKNLARLIEAYRRYRLLRPDGWELVMVGDGPLEVSLRAQAASRQVEGIRWAGRKSTAELPAYYGLAGALVLPSLRETWGLTVNEGMAAGLPVIVSRRCGCAPELVRDRVNGWVIEPRDVHDLTQALTAVSEASPAQRRAMGEASRQRIEAYSLDRWVLQFGACVEAAIARRRPEDARAGLARSRLRISVAGYAVYLGYKGLRRLLRWLGLSFAARRLAGRWLAGLLYRVCRMQHRDGVFQVEGHAMRLAPPGRYPPIDMLMDRYEPSTTALIRQLLRPGMTMVDGGAHVGYYTLLAARAVGPTGRIYAFEPEPHNHALLRQNIERNGYRNVTALPVALWSEAGRIPLFLSRLDNGSHSLRHRLVSGRYEALVETTSLDAFLGAQHWPTVDLIKLDVEGAELEALMGMRELIRRQRRVRLLVEFAPRLLEASGVDPLEFLDVLRGLGFQLDAMTDQGRMPLVRPEAPALVRRLRREASYVNFLCATGTGAEATAREPAGLAS